MEWEYEKTTFKEALKCGLSESIESVRKKIDPGMLKAMFERLRWYLLFIQMGMIAHLWLTQNRWSWLYLLLIPCIVLLLLIDKKHIHPAEVDYFFSRSKIFKRLCDDVNEIKNEMRKGQKTIKCRVGKEKWTNHFEKNWLS